MKRSGLCVYVELKTICTDDVALLLQIHSTLSGRLAGPVVQDNLVRLDAHPLLLDLHIPLRDIDIARPVVVELVGVHGDGNLFPRFFAEGMSCVRRQEEQQQYRYGDRVHPHRKISPQAAAGRLPFEA
jgi:hypothetical protein